MAEKQQGELQEGQAMLCIHRPRYPKNVPLYEVTQAETVFIELCFGVMLQNATEK